ncbi:unnamed protein product [Onchocerca flexuosa]|uniref:Uncharacterized protein n=1 Tax=Onchocerca flexuosa TaxID=387005 RepID=A0A183H1Z6_9BILA|nr:unnamed protein product [Onchocerca flexuosa]
MDNGLVSSSHPIDIIPQGVKSRAAFTAATAIAAVTNAAAAVAADNDSTPQLIPSNYHFTY